MTSPRHLARTAGLLYLAVAIFGGFAHLIVRARVYEQGDAATTAANVLANSDLVRIGVVADLTQATIFVFLGMTLYRLLNHVNKTAASAMVILVAIATTIICLNMVFQFAGLLVTTDSSYAEALGAPGADALVMLLFDLQRYGYLIAQIFFGLWLIPLGYLARRSRQFPNALGLLLIAGGAAYLVGTLTESLTPELGKAIDPFIYIPPSVAEVWMIGHLLLTGIGPIRPRQRTALENHDRSTNLLPSARVRTTGTLLATLGLSD